jgi:hypothetical protein
MATSASQDTPALSVSFAIEPGAQGMLEENHAALAQAEAGFGLDDLSGQIRIAFGSQEIVVQDDISHLAWQLCLGAVPALRAGEPYAASFYEGPGQLRLEPQGDQAELFVNDAAQGLLPRLALAQALLQCAVRLAHAFERLGADDADVQAAAEALLDRAAELDLDA